MTNDIRSSVRVAENVTRSLGRIAIKGTESLYNKELPQSRVGSRELQNIKNSLSHRDLAIIASVKDCRLITTLQLQRLHFTGHDP